MNKERHVLVTFGKGGTTVYHATVKNEHGATKSETQGYRDRASFFAPSSYIGQDTTEHAEDYEGVPFIDMCAAVDTDAGFSWAFKGPMLDVDIEPGSIDYFKIPELVVGAKCKDTVKQADRKAAPRALDSVSIPEWMQGWKEHGAVVGHIRGGKFVEE